MNNKHIKQIFQTSILSALLTLTACHSAPKQSSYSSGQSSKYAKIIEDSITTEDEILSQLDSEALTKYLDTYFPEDLESKYDFPVVHNKQVDKWIRYFTGRGKGWFQGALTKGLRYIPNMRDILETNGLPGDLVYLALIESGFKHKIRSNKNAVGPWQFVKATGKGFGLEIDVWVDERQDPIKATEAAAQYLVKLHDVFNSYYLAIAAYNTGPSRVLRAIRRHKTRNFWKLRTLHRETRDYVPKLIAAIILAKDPESYGFFIDRNVKTYQYATISTSRPINLNKLAKRIGIAPNKLKHLNSELRYAITPPGKKYEIKVPPALKEKAVANLAYARATLPFKGFLSYYVKRGDSLYKIARRHGTKVSTLMAVNRLSYRQVKRLRVGKKIVVPVPNKRNRYAKRRRGNTTRYTARRRVHTVSPGENLWTISKRYRTSIKSLKRANKITNLIKPGQRLVIPSRYRKNTKVSYKKRTVNRRTHTVVPGENLWSISKKYRTSIKKLKRANKISNLIKPGQRLVIPSRGIY